MTDLFISYSRRDRQVAEQLASGLSALGWSVWWDKKIVAGQAFDRTTENAITEARLVLVIWSQNSVNSDWVRAEAGFALRAGKLFPVLIDDATPPLRFIHVHYLDLSRWDRSKGAPGLRDVSAEIANRLGGGPHCRSGANDPDQDGSRASTQPSPRAETSEERPRTLVDASRWLAAVVGVLVIIAGGVTYSTMGLVVPSVEKRAAQPSAATDDSKTGTSSPGRAKSEMLPSRPVENPSTAAVLAVQTTMIGDPVLFEKDAVVLSASARSTIDRLAVSLRDNPQITVTVEGHCSENEGTREGPEVLAQLRANQVRNALKERGVAASRLQIVSYGKSRPVVVGANEAAQIQNRRVVVVRN